MIKKTCTLLVIILLTVSLVSGSAMDGEPAAPKKQEKYEIYGGRGITVCDKWLEFNGFKDDMYESYIRHIKKYGEKQTQIDRIMVNGNYEKINCRWATLKEQASNKRNSRFLTYKGKTKTISQWTECLGASKSFIRNRLNKGWSNMQIFETPKQKLKRKLFGG